ncbi:MAG TPA: universal stress protein [Acidimicrobiales bacterium]
MAKNEIVVGVDGSDASVAALRWAAEEAERSGASVVVVHAWEYPYVGELTGTSALPDARVFEESARAVLDDTIQRAKLPGDLPVFAEIYEGSPSRCLLDRSADALMLVVGARGHGGFLHLLLGSVATQCVNHATVPVVVVPSPGRGSRRGS